MTYFDGVIPRLPVADLQRTIRFYRESLGFAVDVVWPETDPTFAILTRHEASLGFFVLDEHRQGRIGYAELYIEVSDAEELHMSVARRVPIEWGPEVYSYGRREFAIRDPDSYLLVFTEATDDDPTTPEPD